MRGPEYRDLTAGVRHDRMDAPRIPKRVPARRRSMRLRPGSSRNTIVAPARPAGLPQSTMNKIRSDLRVILIGGSSHVGKSTLSRSLADRLGWRLISTDKMARHPGRPWRSASERVPDHAAEHYLTRSVGELITDVLHHYQVNVWPNVETLIRSATTEASSDRMILEGSALWPELIATLSFDGLAALWLTASDDVFRTRIHGESRYHSRSAMERLMADKFLDRTLVYNKQMIDVVNRHGFRLVDVLQSGVAELTDRCLAALNAVQR